MIVYHGGRCQGNLTPQCTHLITAAMEGVSTVECSHRLENCSKIEDNLENKICLENLVESVKILEFVFFSVLQPC